MVASVAVEDTVEDLKELISRIERREARLAVIGLGYVGLPLAVAFAEAGFEVMGIDVDATRVAQLNAGRSYLSSVRGEQLAPLVARGAKAKGGRLSATTSHSRVVVDTRNVTNGIVGEGVHVVRL